jgi:hypothetical protein
MSNAVKEGGHRALAGRLDRSAWYYDLSGISEIWKFPLCLLLRAHFDVSRIPRNVVRTVLVFVLVLWEGIDMKSVEDLDVFKLAHQLALKTYSTTKVFPREETDLKG